jgi:hypothetical protein
MISLWTITNMVTVRSQILLHRQFSIKPGRHNDVPTGLHICDVYKKRVEGYYVGYIFPQRRNFVSFNGNNPIATYSEDGPPTDIADRQAASLSNFIGMGLLQRAVRAVAELDK